MGAALARTPVVSLHVWPKVQRRIASLGMSEAAPSEDPGFERTSEASEKAAKMRHGLLLQTHITEDPGGASRKSTLK